MQNNTTTKPIITNNMTAVEWLEELYYKSAGNLYGDDFEKARAMEQEQMKRIALHFIVLGGQECGCNWNEINFTDEFNKVINR